MNEQGIFSRPRLLTVVAMSAGMGLLTSVAVMAAEPPQSAQAVPVSASDTPSPEEAKELDEVVVTGTLIRGIEVPTGSNPMVMDQQAIQATGAVSTAEIFENIPALGDFGNTNQQISAVNLQITVYRPNIHNIPGLSQAGGSTTLLLLDGNRMAPVGIKDTAPDPNLVPPALIERIEVLPDGGSATYGSDAIGGVINIVTKQHFDGAEADLLYGTAGGYKSYDASTTLGKSWDKFDAFVSYSYHQNSAQFGRDTDYEKQYGNYGMLDPSLTCTPGNVTVGATNYALPALRPGTSNNCDPTGNSSIFPDVHRNSVFGGVNAQFTDSLKLEMHGYYSTQEQSNLSGPYTDQSAITAANPFYEAPPGLGPVPETVSYSWGSTGPQTPSTHTWLTSWGVTPTLTYDFGGARNWQIRSISNYGGSTSKIDNQNPANNPALTAALASTNPATAFDPYDVAATNPAVLNNVLNYELYGLSHQRLLSQQVIGDGGLFALPGGEVRLAVGGQYMFERYEAKQGYFVPGNEGSDPFSLGTRTSYAAFLELNVPIVGPQNEMPGVHSFDLSASGRYDHYSDFGGTTNPKFGVTYEPLDWIKLRANAGTAFNAPSLGDTHAVDDTIAVYPAFIYPDVLPGKYSPSQALYPIVSLSGGLPNIQPQTAHTYEIGTDIKPPVVPGLKLSLTYWHIRYFDIIGTPPVGSPQQFFTYYTNSYAILPTAAQVLAAAGGVPGGLATVAPLLAPGALPIYELNIDQRRNLGNGHFGGLDVAVNYKHSTPFGSIDGSFAGTYYLESESQPLSGLPFINNLDNSYSKLTFAATAGANIGDLRAQATVNYVAGYPYLPTITDDEQSRISSFTTVRLFLRYDLSHLDFIPSAVANNAAVTLTIDNLLDRDPPLYRGAYDVLYNGYANGSTLGRLFEIGFGKKF
jgi:iron complex outermembrane recepter protein